MHASRFTRLGGLAALVGGILWLLTLVLAQVISPESDAILPGAALLLGLGSVAFQARHAGRMGPLGTAGFLTSLAGLLLLAFGSVGEAVIAARVAGIPLQPITLTGLGPGALLLGAGVTMSAIGALIADVLPRLSPLVLAVSSVGVFVAGGLTLVQRVLGGSTIDVLPFELVPLAVLWALFGAGWIWLGFLLWSEPTPPDVVR
jgi:hypothetical protein